LININKFFSVWLESSDFQFIIIVFLIMLLIFIIFFCSYFLYSLNNIKHIIHLFNNNEYEKCIVKINKFTNQLLNTKYNKHALYLYLVNIYSSKGDYLKANEYLNKTTVKKILAGRYLWECIIHLLMDELELAKEKYKLVLSKKLNAPNEMLVLKYIFAFLEKDDKVTRECLESILPKITHPKFKEYCQRLLEKNKVITEAIDTEH